ncbi:MAG: 50S ribosomal protein L4 [Dehalococcoidia bacterium]|nr:50S ribosomal protein L4 [Dehalococcoidia bacterium]MEC7921223.1 50S ribosomal protein L4 [Chloroflexota bacterium]MEC9450843.1 50S ribosomal protein L4 [Chloroflexota bacterium]MQG04712.1 50S ribosomal protein L4 [SAR202 cluster bacterium]|tara:strand:- start:632 stop:1291 length:660 start_codon:yes stop_codon:yes gene_type:complete
MKVDVKNIKGEVIDNFSASDFVWNQSMNETLVHQVVVAQLNNKRQGTSNTLRRRDASYSTAKLRGQKGAGRARVGSRSSHVLGNSVAHGPHPRSYNQKIQKKVRKASLRMVLSEKLKDGEVMVIDKFELKEFSAKKASSIIKSLDLPQKTLIVLQNSEINEKLLGSLKNITNIKTIASNLINTYDIMNSNRLVITREAFKSIEEIWDSNIKKRGSKDED